FLGRAPVGSEASEGANLFRLWEKAWNSGVGHYVYHAELNQGACGDAVLGAAACTANLFGTTTTVNPDLSGLPIGDYNGWVSYEKLAGNVPPALQKELEKPGRLLATRTEFWEEAADHALRRMLGWWKSTPNEPDSDVPEVRKALGAWFRALPGHDI